MNSATNAGNTESNKNKKEKRNSSKNSEEIEERCWVLEYQNNLCLFWLQEEEMIGEHLQKETRVLEETVGK